LGCAPERRFAGMRAHELGAGPSEVWDKKTGCRGNARLDEGLAAEDRQLLAQPPLDAAMVCACWRHEDATPRVEFHLAGYVAEADVVAHLAVAPGQLVGRKRRFDQLLVIHDATHSTLPFFGETHVASTG